MVEGMLQSGKIVKKSVHLLGNLLRSLQIGYLRMAGVRIGNDCMLSLRAKIDARRGLVVIGDRCTITYGCVILSHDASVHHINPADDGSGQVVIEDDVYIGVNSVILRNVRIGKNSVIGAGSVVTRDIPPNVVAVGNPAIVIKEIERFKNQ